MASKKFSEYLEKGSENVLFLRDCTFAERCFSDFYLRPENRQKIEISNVQLIGCKVKNGASAIRKGVSLRDFVMQDFVCSDALHISAEVFMSNVKIVGNKKPSILWIKKQSECSCNSNSYPDGHIALDISDYSGEVCIIGINSKFVKRNPKEHIVIDLELLDGFNWKKAGISAVSYWKLMVKKVAAAKANEGIFSMPPETGRNYKRSLAELDILRSERLVK